MTPAALGVQERLAFTQLRRRAVLREAAAGLYYLDEPRWERLRSTRRRMALLVGLLVLAAAVAGWLRF